MKTFKNWAGNQTCQPALQSAPSSLNELSQAVVDADLKGHKIRVVGAGHSFTAAVCTDGLLLSLDGMQRIIDVDTENARITVEAGISLATLSETLDEHGLALPNMGDIAYQSVAGATATGTHGTGRNFPVIPNCIVGMDLVTATGEVLHIDENSPMLSSARVSLGALGVVANVTLQVVPAFRIHAVEEPMEIDVVLNELDDRIAENEHFEFFWLPHTTTAITKTNTHTDAPAEPPSALARWRDEILIENALLSASCQIGRRRPSIIPKLARTAAKTLSAREYTDKSYRVFATERKVRFLEMEYAIPLESLREAFEAVQDLIGSLGQPISFPIEVRCSAADEIPLSMAYGRASGYIAVHMYRNMPHENYFQQVEQIMQRYGGRPHWGKLHYQNAASLASVYPAWQQFQDVRAELDPDGVFTNSYVERVLGLTRPQDQQA